ncbi:MAG: hypothetical protein ACE5EE_03075 [Fidelibacterota bacterium]
MSFSDNNRMMKIEDIINDVVLIVVEDAKGLNTAGIDQEKFYAKVIGYDEFGLWVEHPSFEVVISEDSEGKPLPPEKVTREKFCASVQVQWRNISTLVHFPNREGFDFPSPFDLQIGFNPEEG